MEEMWKQLKDNALAATICCAGPFRFRTLEEDTFLESVAAAGGRIVRQEHPSAPATYESRYFITDHLGGTRVVVDSLGTIVQQVDYLPYGEKCNNPTLISGENDYLYCGKEFQAPVFNIPWYDSQARFQTTDGMFVSLDPQCEKYYSISPYAYCAGNPVRYVDRDGGVIETAWDIANVVAGVASFAANVAAGNVGGAIVDAVGIVADAASFVAPGIPGGASAGIKAIRAGKMADKAIDTARAVDKGSDVLRAADKSSDALGTIDKAENLAKKAKGRYVNLPEPKNAGPGKRATPKQKKQILEQNQSLNGGQIRSDESGDVLSPLRRYHKGERADMNQAEIDHIKPRSKGGSNHNSNLRVVSKRENLVKGNR